MLTDYLKKTGTMCCIVLNNVYLCVIKVRKQTQSTQKIKS